MSEANAPGVGAAKIMRPLVQGYMKHSRQEQRERKRWTGHAGKNAELGHATMYAMRTRALREARMCAHLVSLEMDFLFQSIPIVSVWCGQSPRTTRRARTKLEAEGLIVSRILHAGEMLPGMRAPVTRTVVVRDLRPLRAYVAKLTAQQRMRRGKVDRGAGGRLNPSRRRPVSRDAAAARTPAEVPVQAAPLSAEDWAEIAARSGDAHLVGVAAHKRAIEQQKQHDANKRRTIFDEPERVPPTEVDAWEAVTEELEELSRRDTVRVPPPDK